METGDGPRQGQSRKNEQNSSKTSIHSQLNDFNEKCHYVIHLKKKYFAHMISLILKNMNTIQRR